MTNGTLPVATADEQAGAVSRPALPAITVALPASRYRFVPRQPNLLDALRSEGFDLPFQCRAGYCGRCRVQLCQGEVRYRQQPLAWLNPGEILPCCCIATSDLTLQLPEAVVATGHWQD